MAYGMGVCGVFLNSLFLSSDDLFFCPFLKEKGGIRISFA